MVSFIIGTLIMSLSIGAIVGVVLFITRRMNAPGCVHRWTPMVRLYRKPFEWAMPTAKGGLPVDQYLKVMEKVDEMRQGQTLVVLVCDRCGAIRDRVYPGVVAESVADEKVSLESDGGS